MKPKKADTEQWFVLIFDNAGAEVARIPCGSAREAEKVKRGVNINLNHADYHTEISHRLVTKDKPHTLTPRDPSDVWLEADGTEG